MGFVFGVFSIRHFKIRKLKYSKICVIQKFVFFDRLTRKNFQKYNEHIYQLIGLEVSTRGGAVMWKG